jgi:hypothetical protein
MRSGGQVGVFLGFSAGVIVLLLWLAGWFVPKVPMKTVEEETPAYQGRTTAVGRVPVRMSEAAVGTIGAVHQTSVGSKLLARVVELDPKKVKAGGVVKKDDLQPGGRRRTALPRTGPVAGDQPAGIRKGVHGSAFRRSGSQSGAAGGERSAGHARLRHGPLAHGRPDH